MVSPSLGKYEIILNLCCGEFVHEKWFFREVYEFFKTCDTRRREYMRDGIFLKLPGGSDERGSV